MALLLHIDTATSYAGVCISEGQNVLALREHHLQKDHAAFLQPAIADLMQETGIALTDIDAVAVTGGPGSYTGIRVGLASAKGICYAIKKPLIILNTLVVIATAAKVQIPLEERDKDCLYYPMIDARRMEVFGGLYNQELCEVGKSSAIILDQPFIDELNCHSKVIFCGDGAQKLQTFTLPENYSITKIQHTVNHMIIEAEKAFQTKKFADLAYAEPIYVKEFYQAKSTKPSTTTN